MTTAKNLWRSLFYSLIFSLSVLWGTAGYTQDPVELSKADYKKITDLLFNIARLSEWPVEAFDSKEDKFIIGVLGDEIFTEKLQQNIKSKTLFDREVQVINYSISDNYSRSHLLFISRAVEENLNQILTNLIGTNVMTVSDIPDFGELGGMFGLAYKRSPESRTNDLLVRFQINTAAVKAAGITVSLALGKLGEVVNTKRPLKDNDTEVIRIAILPPWDFPGPNWKGVGEGFYRALSKNKGVRVTHAADPLLAKQLGAETLLLDSSNLRTLWKPGPKTQNSEPNLDAIFNVTQDLDIDAVFLYSSPRYDPSMVPRRAYLIDLKTRKVHQLEKFFFFEVGYNFTFQANQMGTKLLNNYLASTKSQDAEQVDLAIRKAESEGSISREQGEPETEKIQIAVLSPRVFQAPFKSEIRKNFLKALTSNPSIEIAYTDVPIVAKQTGAKKLDNATVRSKGLWKSGGRSVHTGLNLEVLKDISNELGVKAIVTYSLPDNWDVGFKVFLFDVETNKLYEGFKYISSHFLTNEVGELTANTVREYLDSLESTNTRLVKSSDGHQTNEKVIPSPKDKLQLEPPGSRPIRTAILTPWQFNSPHKNAISQGFYNSLVGNNAIKITHTVDANLAKKINGNVLNEQASHISKLWEPTRKTQHSQPNIDAVLGLLSGEEVELAIMYSLPNDFYRKGLRIYLIDLAKREVFQEFEFVHDHGLHMAAPAEALTDKLVGDYLTSREISPIRIAVFSPREFQNPLRVDVRNNFINSLIANSKFNISYAADPSVADKTGAKLLDDDLVRSKSIWKPGGRGVHTDLDLDVLEGLSSDLNIRAIVTYSLPDRSWDVGFKVFVYDLVTKRLHQETTYIFGFHSATQYGTFISKTLENYLDSLDNQKASMAGLPDDHQTKSPVILTPQDKSQLEPIGPRPIRIAILPPWAHNAPNKKQYGQGFYQSLISNKNFEITHVFDSNLANQIGAHLIRPEKIKIDQIWKPRGKTDYGEPDLQAIKILMQELDVQTVAMYSLAGRNFEIGFRVFLVDRDSEIIYRKHRYTVTASYSYMAKAVTNELLGEYLHNTGLTSLEVVSPTTPQDPVKEESEIDITSTKKEKIRIAVLPPRVFQSRFRREVDKNFLSSLASNRSLEIAYAYDSAFAKQNGAEKLESGTFDSNKIWQSGGRGIHTDLNLEILKELSSELDARAIVTYSLPDQVWAVGFKIYLLDLETGELYQELENSSFHYLPDDARKVTANVVQYYVNNLEISESPQ